jgi:hypothetical protein
MGWIFKPPWNSNGLDLQATTKFKWVGSPSHYISQMGWTSKPLQRSNGLELQATTTKIKGWNSKPLQNSNGLELQATAKFKWHGTQMQGQHSISNIHLERLQPILLLFDHMTDKYG